MSLILTVKKYINNISISAVALIVLIISNMFVKPLNAQVDPDLSNALQRCLDSLRTKNSLPGVTAAVTLPDISIWTGASGLSDTDTKDSIKSDMLLSIGSITKTFTCAIIMQLASENKLSLEDSLHKWLPKFKNVDSSITIRQLLNHTSGIYNFTDNDSLYYRVLADPSKRFQPEEIASDLKAPLFKAGARFSYSNTNYLLLGMIIKKTAGSDVSVELHKRLLLPYNLNDTYLEAEDTIKSTIAVGWSDINFDGKFENLSAYSRIGLYSAAWTAGAMVSSASDLAMWARYLYGGNVLPKKYLDEMINFTNISGRNYGLGTMKNIFLQKEFWGHAGSINGYVAYTGYCKQHNLSIAVLINRDNFNPETLIPGLLKTTLNYLPTSVNETIQQPSKFYLDQNFPNPFNPETNIAYQLPVASQVELKVFNLLGSEIATLVNKQQNAGHYQVKFDASSLSSGMYFYRLKAGNSILTKKMILVR